MGERVTEGEVGGQGWMHGGACEGDNLLGDLPTRSTY